MSKESIDTLVAEIRDLKTQLKQKELTLSELLCQNPSNETNIYCNKLYPEEVTRYSRQILVPDVGIKGQVALRDAKVFIVGAGGLGCPASVYLATAGVGEITIMDYDEVELSNLHRQILHTEDDVGLTKVNSVYDKLHSINRKIKIIPLKQHADSDTIRKLFSDNKYDVVIDGSDNVATRYLLNDACVLYGMPLVSGSALQLEGQLTVYNYKMGPCYRCVFPVPPPPETVTSCGDGGVIGPVPGVIGVLQALEAIKIITNSIGVLTGRLLLFDGAGSKFRNVKLRPRNVNCSVCGDEPSQKELIDYEQFCGAVAHDKVININILNGTDHIGAEDLPDKLGNSLVLDVRPPVQFDMCRLPNTLNVPFSDLRKPETLENLRSILQAANSGDVYVLCRRGNDSQRAVTFLRENMSDLPIKFYNVRDGLEGYSRKVDTTFPVF